MGLSLSHHVPSPIVARPVDGNKHLGGPHADRAPQAATGRMASGRLTLAPPRLPNTLTRLVHDQAQVPELECQRWSALVRCRRFCAHLAPYGCLNLAPKSRLVQCRVRPQQSDGKHRVCPVSRSRPQALDVAVLKGLSAVTNPPVLVESLGRSHWTTLPAGRLGTPPELPIGPCPRITPSVASTGFLDRSIDPWPQVHTQKMPMIHLSHRYWKLAVGLRPSGPSACRFHSRSDIREHAEDSTFPWADTQPALSQTHKGNRHVRLHSRGDSNGVPTDRGNQSLPNRAVNRARGNGFGRAPFFAMVLLVSIVVNAKCR